MARRKKAADVWVIFARPRQQGPGPTRDLYFAGDGTTTDQKAQAEKFYSYEAAAEFAKKNNINLDGVMRYAQKL